MSKWRWKPYLVKPCGSTAAARRHRYHGERVCSLCAEAERRAWAGRPAEQRTRAGRLTRRVGSS